MPRANPVTCSILRGELVLGEFLDPRISDLGCQWISVASEVSRPAHRRTFGTASTQKRRPLQPSHSVQSRREASPGIASVADPFTRGGLCYYGSACNQGRNFDDDGCQENGGENPDS